MSKKKKEDKIQPTETDLEPRQDTSNEKAVTLFERYKLVVHARNFHYDNFNKWMTYFYVAIAALFVGYFGIKEDKANKNILDIIIPVLGYVVSLLFYWSSKGYYYWNIHWIKLVQHYEKELLKWDVTERVYFIFSDKSLSNSYWSPVKGANFSTSKLAIFFSFLVAIAWGTLITGKLIAFCVDCNVGLIYLLAFFISIVVTVGISSAMQIGPFNSFISDIPDLSEELKTQNQDTKGI